MRAENGFSDGTKRTDGTDMNQTIMDAERRRDETLAQRRNPGADGLQYSVSKAALMNAVRTEGRDILTEKGAEYWRDQERKYPHMRGKRTDTGYDAAGTRTPYGRVSFRARFSEGKIVRERRVCGKWVREEAVR